MTSDEDRIGVCRVFLSAEAHREVTVRQAELGLSRREAAVAAVVEEWAAARIAARKEREETR